MVAAVAVGAVATIMSAAVMISSTFTLSKVESERGEGREDGRMRMEGW